MAFFSDTQETASRFADYIEEFQKTFRANGIGFGSPEDFFAVARKLNAGSQLRADLSRLVKSIIDRESGTVSLRTILTIIALASGGPQIADSGHTTSKPVNLFIDFLIGIGGYTRIDSDKMDGMYPVTSETDGGPIPGDRKDLSPVATRRSQVLAAEPQDVTAIAAQSATLEELPTNAPDSSTDSSTALNQSLTRLELNSLQVKLYLDSIDQRISRMEPRLEGLPSPAEHIPPLESSAGQPAIPPAAVYSKLDAHPQDSNAQQFAPPAKKASPRFFLPAFLSGKNAIVLPVLLGLVAVLAALLLYQSFWRNPAHRKVVRVAPVNATPAIATPPVPAPTVAGAAAPLSPALRTTEDPPRKRSAQTLFRSKPASALPVVSKGAAATGPSTATRTTAQGVSNSSLAPAMAASEPPLPRRIDVPSSVMAANLISAPEPAYPKLARLTHMRGMVVLQVAISTSGTVEDLHVIKGHRLLRGAAMNAVRTWRYRPYLLNGRPTEVATVVSVDVPSNH